MEPKHAELYRALILFTLAYLATHTVGLTRELAYEEGLFIQPGLNLLNGHGFSWSWGELYPNGNAFHKPPLLSLLAGLLAFTTQTFDFGPKLLPFFVGLFCVLLPRIFVKDNVASFLLLVSPFFIAASSHVQTDPTVGLLGYGLVCFGAASILRDQSIGKKSNFAVISGTLVLWLGKVEIAVFASAILLLAVVLAPNAIRRKFARLVAQAGILGLLSLLGSSFLLGLTAELGWNDSAAEVFHTIVRITTDTASRNLNSPATGFRGGHSLFLFLSNYGAVYLFILLSIPVLAAVVHRNFWVREGRVATVLIVGTLLPTFTYFIVGYAGDGFPRYFLIIFLPLAMLSAMAREKLAGRMRIICAAGMLVGAILLLVPGSVAMQLSKRNPTAPGGDFGYKQAAALLLNATRKDDLLAVPEPCFLYLKGRRTIQLDSFEPYASQHPIVLARQNEVRALAVPDSVLRSNASCVSKTFAAHLRSVPHIEQICGSLVVIIRNEDYSN